MNEQSMTIEVEPTNQCIAYMPGNGSVVWINDKADQNTLSGLNSVQRAVAAARFRALAAMLDEAP